MICERQSASVVYALRSVVRRAGLRENSVAVSKNGLLNLEAADCSGS